MASLNKVLLIGNLTREPELRYTSGGAAVCGFGLAINRRYTTASGEQRDEVCFVDIDTWGKQGETCKTYLRKGSPALIEGHLRLDSWQDRETGKPRSRLTVTAERVQFLGSPRGEFGGAPEEDAGQEPQAGGYQPQGGGYQPQGGGYQPQGGGYQPQPQYAPQAPPPQAPPQQGYAQPAASVPPPRPRPQPPAPVAPPAPAQMPAFEQPADTGDALDDIPF